MLVDELEVEVARKLSPALLEKSDGELKEGSHAHVYKDVICAVRDEEDGEKVARFLKLHAQCLRHDAYEELLLGLLESTNAYVRFKAGETLSFLYAGRTPSSKFCAFISKCLEVAKPPSVPKQAMTFVQRVLERRENKELYINDRFIGIMHRCLEQRELQYHALLLVWILSFEKRVLPLLKTHGIPCVLIDIVREQSKEKVLRVCYAILANLYEHGFRLSVAKNNVLLDCIGHAEEKINDEELHRYTESLKRYLVEMQQKGTLVESYFSELFENRLDDSACHFDPGFWTANAAALMAKKVEIIKALKKHLRSHNTKFICLAANDIHMLLKHVPDVYYYVERLKIKDDLVELSMSDDNDVKFYAVKALATCIFTEWS